MTDQTEAETLRYLETGEVPKVRLCVECARFLDIGGGRCGHPLAAIPDLVYGKDSDYRYADSMRAEQSPCGIEGKLWEAKA